MQRKNQHGSMYAWQIFGFFAPYTLRVRLLAFGSSVLPSMVYLPYTCIHVYIVDGKVSLQQIFQGCCREIAGANLRLGDWPCKCPPKRREGFLCMSPPKPAMHYKVSPSFLRFANHRAHHHIFIRWSRVLGDLALAAYRNTVTMLVIAPVTWIALLSVTMVGCGSRRGCPHPDGQPGSFQ